MPTIPKAGIRNADDPPPTQDEIQLLPLSEKQGEAPPSPRVARAGPISRECAPIRPTFARAFDLAEDRSPSEAFLLAHQGESRPPSGASRAIAGGGLDTGGNN